MDLSFIPKNWIGPLWKKLTAIRAEREAAVDEIGRVFGIDPHDLAEVYVEPGLQSICPSDIDEENESIPSEYAFQYIDKFLSKRIVNRDGRQFLFVLGDAGMGKTSLLVMLRLFHLTSFFPKDYDCTLLKLGEDTLGIIAQIPNPARHVLLLDSLDEDSELENGIEARTLDILRVAKNFERVVLTCRTQFLPEHWHMQQKLEISNFLCQLTYLSPFDDGRASLYLRKRYPDKRYFGLFRKKNLRRDEANNIVSRKMGTLRMRPLLLSYIEDLIGSGGDRSGLEALSASSLSPVFDVYTILMNNWLRREEGKLRDADIFDVKADDLREMCRKIALRLTMTSRRHMSTEEIRGICIECGAEQFVNNFVIGGRSLLVRTSDQRWRFAHYSIQEFLVFEIAKAGADGIGSNLVRLTPTHFTLSLLDELRTEACSEFIRLMPHLASSKRTLLSEAELGALHGTHHYFPTFKPGSEYQHKDHFRENVPSMPSGFESNLKFIRAAATGVGWEELGWEYYVNWRYGEKFVISSIFCLVLPWVRSVFGREYESQILMGLDPGWRIGPPTPSFPLLPAADSKSVSGVRNGITGWALLALALDREPDAHMALQYFVTYCSAYVARGLRDYKCLNDRRVDWLMRSTRDEIQRAEGLNLLDLPIADAVISGLNGRPFGRMRWDHPLLSGV